MDLCGVVLAAKFEALARNVQERLKCPPELFADRDELKPQAGPTIPTQHCTGRGQERVAAEAR